MKMTAKCLAILVVATCLTMFVGGCETIMNPPIITGCKTGEPCPPTEDVYSGYDSKLASDSAVDGGKTDASTGGKGGSEVTSDSSDNPWKWWEDNIEGLYAGGTRSGKPSVVKWMMTKDMAMKWCKEEEGFINIVGAIGLCVPSPTSSDDLYLTDKDGVKIFTGSIKQLTDTDQTCKGGRIMIVKNTLGKDPKTITVTVTYCKIPDSTSD